jgi:hypothetical protein
MQTSHLIRPKDEPPEMGLPDANARVTLIHKSREMVARMAGVFYSRDLNYTAPCGMATRYTDLSHTGRDSRKSSVKALAQKHGIARASICCYNYLHCIVESLNPPKVTGVGSCSNIHGDTGDLSIPNFRPLPHRIISCAAILAGSSSKRRAATSTYYGGFMQRDYLYYCELIADFIGGLLVGGIVICGIATLFNIIFNLVVK